MADSSLRMQGARLAREAALSVDGVDAADAGATGTRASVGGGDIVPGVVAIADGEGTIGLDLYLVARPVPLGPLADRVRQRILSRAVAADLGGAIGRVDVRFEDLVPESAQ
jgi:hypothetical protein